MRTTRLTETCISQRRSPWKCIGLLSGIAFGSLAVFVMVLPVFADGADEHHGATTTFSAGPVLWGGLSLGVVLLLMVGLRSLLVRQVAPAGGDGQRLSYWGTVRQFSKNARLFLAYSLMAELGTGIWAVLFNLYLLRLEFSITFIGTFWLLNMLFHGIAALPAGVIGDRFGRRRSFFIATTIALIAQGSLLFTREPAVILAFAAMAGMGEAFHGVTGAPFMMENSEPGERPHLFSLNSAFLQLSRFGGNIAGGFLPLALAVVLGTPAVDPAAARGALVLALPLTMVALFPLAFMKEKPVERVEDLRQLVMLRNVVHAGIVARLALLSLLVGTGFGLTIRFFNVFFKEVHSASDSEIGTILAFGALASAGSILVSPLLAQHWGKAKGILLSQMASIPFLLLMALVPSLTAVTVFYVVRGAFYALGQPLRNQLSMEFVVAKERGTTAGFTHTAFDLGGGVGAGVAGLLITASGDFVPTFTVAATLIAVPAVLYFLFFDRMEARDRDRVASVAPAPAGN
ncbi:MAG: MFS transporter [Chloroflexi bacterium]|nr:MFS transporter [Chloroflexota bacterium]